MLARRHVRWARLTGLTALLFSVFGANCNDDGGDSVVLDPFDRCRYSYTSATLAMESDPDLPGVGETVEVTVSIYQGCQVAGVPFRLRFDPGHLRFVSGAPGSFLASEGGNVSFLAALDSQEPGVLNVGNSILGVPPGGGVSGSGDLCARTFEVLPGAADAGQASLTPIDFSVFQPGLREQRSSFPSLTIELAGP
jgi:hypothetical protein